MADVISVFKSLALDISKFRIRVARLSPRLDGLVMPISEKALDVEELIREGKVENEIYPHVKEALLAYEEEVQAVYARQQDAISRMLEAAAHLNEIETILQQIETRRAVFERLINREKGSTDENL